MRVAKIIFAIFITLNRAIPLFRVIFVSGIQNGEEDGIEKNRLNEERRGRAVCVNYSEIF